MPSKTFFHLPAEKRERLLLAAEEEFARVPYAEASINRMIRAAGIPRGSFYMYFRDKEELFHYPVLGWILKRVGAFPVSRGNNDIQSVKTAIQAIKAGDNLLIFPEGTVIRNGIGCADGLPATPRAGWP